MNRAAAALERQRPVDRHSGNRATLTRTLEERRQMLAQVQHARIEALTPLPELASIAAELEHEIGELERHLGQADAQLTPTVAGLLARINAAQAIDDLTEVRQFIQQATAYGLLQRNELDRLYRAMNDKTGLLYDKAELSRENRSDRPKPRFFDLRRAVARGEPFTLVIDGHNVLHALEDIFGRHFADGHPGTKARFEFADRLNRIFDRPGADVLLYFDGDDPSERSLSDQVRVVYSGGTGEHRADEAILKRLSFYFQSAPSAPVCLVTRDADLARQASAMGATIIHPEEFAASLDLAGGRRL